MEPEDEMIHPRPLSPAELKVVAKHCIDASEHFVLWTEHSVLCPEGVAAHPALVGLLSPPSQVRALLGIARVLGGGKGHGGVVSGPK